jgi:hypothetical protein
LCAGNAFAFPSIARKKRRKPRTLSDIFATGRLTKKYKYGMKERKKEN